MPAIEVEGLVKHYKNVQALKGLNLKVEPGEIYGLLGRNGAGKTTLVKILLGLVRPTSGRATLLGRSAGDPGARLRVGYLPEDHRFPDYHTAESALDFYGGLSEMPRAERRRRIPEFIEQVGLTAAAKRKIRTYSKGMKQRLGLAQAMLHDPEVLFLDEPTDGVDPVGRKEVRDLLVRLKERKRTIFLNSHLLSEVELVTDRVGILELGVLRREGAVGDLTTQKNIYEIRLAGKFDPLLPEVLTRVKGARRISEGLEVDVDDVAQLNGLIDFLRSRGIELSGLHQKRESLEDVFIKTLEKPDNGPGAARAS